MPRGLARRRARALCAALVLAPALAARAETALAPFAELSTQRLPRGEILEWSGGLAVEHSRWRALAQLSLREERSDATRSAEHGLELVLERRLGSRLALALSSGFDLAAGPRNASLALELSVEF